MQLCFGMPSSFFSILMFIEPLAWQTLWPTFFRDQQQKREGCHVEWCEA